MTPLVPSSVRTLLPPAALETQLINQHQERNDRQQDQADEPMRKARNALFDRDMDGRGRVLPLAMNLESQGIGSRGHRWKKSVRFSSVSFTLVVLVMSHREKEP